MNVLILSPDAVGGTLLHSLITINMQFHKFNKPVIGIKDVSLGVSKYFSTDFNREILTLDKHYQSLEQIQNTLESVDHYKVAKLTHYNIVKRRDTVEQEVPFYNYLNDNYFVIACRRDNVFEHALSWGINKITNRLNVFSLPEKADTFLSMYKEGIKIDPISLERSLNSYKRYLDWCDTNFSVASYYRYEHHMKNIEQYILDLPIFNDQEKKHTWSDVFGIDFSDWNRYHYLAADIGGLALENKAGLNKLLENAKTQASHKGFVQDNNAIEQEFLKAYQVLAGADWPVIHSINEYHSLSEDIKQQVKSLAEFYLDTIELNNNKKNSTYTNDTNKLVNYSYTNLASLIEQQSTGFLTKHSEKYKLASGSIEKMCSLGIIPKTLPVKKQTLVEKAMIVKNFAECVDVYNRWIDKNPDIGQPVNKEELIQLAKDERSYWTGNKNEQINLLSTVLDYK